MQPSCHAVVASEVGGVGAAIQPAQCRVSLARLTGWALELMTMLEEYEGQAWTEARVNQYHLHGACCATTDFLPQPPSSSSSSPPRPLTLEEVAP